MNDRRSLALEILSSSVNRLCLDMRFLTMAVFTLRREVLPGSGDPTCDGRTITFHEDSVIEGFREDPNIITHQLAHCVMHCILGHTHPDGSDALLLAEDMVVEYVLDSFDMPHVNIPGRDDRVYACERIFKHAGSASMDLLVPEVEDLPEWKAGLYMRQFHVDDNHRHPVEDTPEWQELSQQAMAEVEGFVRRSDIHTETFLSVLRIRNRKRYDYRSFLRKFMTMKPNVHENMDEFDPIFYTYGLQTYGNIPLIDSLESSDQGRVQEFVIAIDTSGSTMRGPVMAFLEEAFSVLRQTGIGRGVNLHVIQCDNEVRRDDVVHDERELHMLMSSFELVGGNGTDFRPVFTYVDSLIERGEFRRLRGLMYFTDGKGTYPEKRPSYDTAFVFCDDRYLEHTVPPWAMKLVIGTADLIGKG